MGSATQEKISVYIKWMVKRDMPEILEIENQCFKIPWLEEDFTRCLRQRNCVGIAAEFEDRIVGYMIYELCKTRLHVLNFAVHPCFQRKGAGAAMCQILINKLNSERRTKIFMEIRESNLTAQLFFRKMGFLAICIIHNLYEICPDEDAYLMQYSIEKEPAAFHGKNRIGPLFWR